jgi:hypothetical protein
MAKSSQKITNPYAPKYDPEHWNDLNLVRLNFLLATHHPDVMSGFEKIQMHLSPNNLHRALSKYDDAALAIGLKVKRHYIENFRRDVQTLMRARQLSTNCYCHAVDDTGPFPGFTRPWPGMIHGLKPSDGKTYDAKRIIENSEADGAIPIGLKPSIREGFYNIGLLIRSDGKEIHYVRENSNGQYSHKTGMGPVCNTDAEENLITDPLQADWGDFEIKQFFHVPQGGLIIGIPLNDRESFEPDMHI